MVTFKKFLEASITDPVYNTDVNLQQAVDFINNKASNMKKLILNDQYLYRGVADLRDNFVLVDSKKSTRKSENTANYYTALMDNLPELSYFPKRSKSFICTTSEHIAYNYGHVYYTIPADNSKIGFVNNTDIWNVKLQIFGSEIYFEGLTNFFERCKVKDTYENILDFADELSKGDQDAIDCLTDALRYFNIEYKTAYARYFMEEIENAFSPDKTGFTWKYAKDVNSIPKNSEVWVSGETLFVNSTVMHRLKKELV